MGAPLPDKFMDVCDVRFSCRQHDDQSEEHPRERIWIIRVASEIAFQPSRPTLALCRTREEPNLHLELYLRDVTYGMRSRKLPVGGFQKL